MICLHQDVDADDADRYCAVEGTDIPRIWLGMCEYILDHVNEVDCEYVAGVLNAWLGPGL